MYTAESGEGERPGPTGALYVPVRLGRVSGHHLCFLRTPLGVRTAVGFTSRERLSGVLGEEQAWIRLAEPVVRALAEPLGVLSLIVDPQLTAPGPARTAAAVPSLAPVCVRRLTGATEESLPAEGALRASSAVGETARPRA
ncbi:SAV_915 family protein [Streptomyces sp. NPDC005963]|uniref:SAV_915 family protein n=1 Tax=Streptomyces sp. NPDC005963 TaxID=3156721 RepID=UPI0033EB1FAF